MYMICQSNELWAKLLIIDSWKQNELVKLQIIYQRTLVRLIFLGELFVCHKVCHKEKESSWHKSKTFRSALHPGLIPLIDFSQRISQTQWRPLNLTKKRRYIFIGSLAPVSQTFCCGLCSIQRSMKRALRQSRNSARSSTWMKSEEGSSPTTKRSPPPDRRTSREFFMQAEPTGRFVWRKEEQWAVPNKTRPCAPQKKKAEYI